MKQVDRSIAAVTQSVLLSGTCISQATQAKKSSTFRGKVEAVDPNERSLTVNGEEVKGWMAAMTMDYEVDDPTVLQTVKRGDEIMAVLYDGDLVPHEVQIAPKNSGRYV